MFYLVKHSSIHFTFVLGFSSPQDSGGGILPVTPGRDRRKTARQTLRLRHLQARCPREGQHHGRRHRWLGSSSLVSAGITHPRTLAAPPTSWVSLNQRLSMGLALPAGKLLEGRAPVRSLRQPEAASSFHLLAHVCHRQKRSVS